MRTFFENFIQNFLSKLQLKYFLIGKPLKLFTDQLEASVSPAGCEGTVNILFCIASTDTKHIGSSEVAYCLLSSSMPVLSFMSTPKHYED